MQELIKHMQEQLLSLIQEFRITELQAMNETGDLTILRDKMNSLESQIKLTKSYLSVANAILASSNERE
jgi:outer membrane lipopolysaccharide assembly protein LptE/RlpB